MTFSTSHKWITTSFQNVIHLNEESLEFLLWQSSINFTSPMWCILLILTPSYILKVKYGVPGGLHNNGVIWHYFCLPSWYDFNVCNTKNILALFLSSGTLPYRCGLICCLLWVLLFFHVSHINTESLKFWNNSSLGVLAWHFQSSISLCYSFLAPNIAESLCISFLCP